MKRGQYAPDRFHDSGNERNQMNFYQSEEGQLEISPQFRKHHSREYQRSDNYPQQPFSFDEPTCKQRERSSTLNFSEFDITGQQKVFARDLVLQNSSLKEELLTSKQIINQLKTELADCHQHLNKRNEQSQKQNIFKVAFIELRQELEMILAKNIKMEEELNSLREAVKENKIKYERGYQSDLYLKKSSKSLEKYPKTSFQLTSFQDKGYVDQGINLKGEQNLKRFEDLLESIKGMYTKIMGVQIRSLKQLWRWLKHLGNLYSFDRKWRSKAIDLMSFYHIHPDKMRELINEALAFY